MIPSGWRRRTLLAAGSIVVALLLAEFTIRVVTPQLLQWDTGAIWEPVHGLGWQRRPNVDVHIDTGERDARYLTDDARHRVGSGGRVHGDLRILAIGDSMIEAVQVEHEQTMTGLLERSLSSRLGRTVEIVNTGIGGYNPNQYLMVAKSELQQTRYDLVVVFVYVENDFVGHRTDSYPADPDLIRPPLHPFRDAPSETLRVLGVRLRAVLAVHSHLFVLVRNALPHLRRLSDPPPPGIVHLFSAALRTNRDVPEWEITADILSDIGKAADRAGVPVLFVLLPSSAYVDPERRALLERLMRRDPSNVDPDQPAERLGEELRQRGRDLEDATPALRTAFDAGNRDLYGTIDMHMSPVGHQVMAQFLEPVIATRVPR